MTLFELFSFLGLLLGVGLAVWFGTEHGLLAALLGGALAIPTGIVLGVAFAFGLITVAHFSCRLEDWILARLPHRQRASRSPEER